MDRQDLVPRDHSRCRWSPEVCRESFYREKKAHAKNDGQDGQDGFPIFAGKGRNRCDVSLQRRICLPKNIQTDVAIQIDVRMIDLLGAFHFGWRMRIFRFDRERECKATSSVVTLDERRSSVKNECGLCLAYIVWCDCESEMKKVIFVRISHLTCRRQGAQFSEI